LASKIRILTYHHIQNNGAFLFAYALIKLLEEEFPGSEVRIIDYKTTRLALYEYLKRFKILPGIPFFYFRRSLLWDRLLEEAFELDADLPRFSTQTGLQGYFSDHYDALVVGMDVWCVINGTERPPFPNIYWLPEKMDIPKIAYGVSAYNSDPALIRSYSHQIAGYLDGFDVIGARDRFTYDMVLEQRTHTGGLVERIPDPTFLYEFGETGAASKMASLGVDFNRPLVGILLYGDDERSKNICAHYRAMGCQILAMSMYNRFADINLGHLMTPFEWAESFRFLSFCITDRFHGTLFCLKSGIPFISLEKERHLPTTQSKIYDLLVDFNLTQCYMNPGDDRFSISRMLQHADALHRTWEQTFKPGIAPAIQAMKTRQREFVDKMKVLVGL
jgi:hypothetical protein